MIRSLVLLMALALPLPTALAAQQLTLPAASLADSASRSVALGRIAIRAAQLYQDSSEVVEQDDLFHLYLLAHRYSDAAVALANWRRAWAMYADTTARGRAVNLQYEIYLRAKRLQGDSAGFPDAFARAFRERFARLDDRTAALVARTLLVLPPLPPRIPSSDTTMAIRDVVAWLRAMQIAEAYQTIGPAAAPLIREDDARRYAIE